MKLRKALAHYRMMGFWDTFRHGLAGFLLRDRGGGFDAKHGTDTGGVLSLRHDEAPTPGQQVRSLPSHPRVVRFILENLGIDHREFTFIDFGCGKGRVLLCASEFPFARIIGVEWSHDLCSVARRNIEIFRSPRQKCAQLEVHCTNVLDFEFPITNILLYMYNPFGPKLTRQAFEHIQRHSRAMPGQFLVAFSGLGRLEEGFVTECCRHFGLDILRDYRTFTGSSSWVLLEAPGLQKGRATKRVNGSEA